LREITKIALNDFNLPGIVGQLHITKSGDEFEVAWDGSYGVSGTLRAKEVSIVSRPGMREERLAAWQRLRR
jgi:hypothetical protein